MTSLLSEPRDQSTAPTPVPRPSIDLPAVSVVIPAHNYGHFLSTAIDSVLAQSHSALEVVVVDDGSTDDTREVVASYSDPRVRYIWQENAGLSAARNKGIQCARMPFVAFLDADDQWLPEFLGEVMRQFAILGNRFALVATGTGRMDESGRRLAPPRFNFDHGGEFAARDFVLRNRPLSSSIVARRSVFAECGLFDTSLRSSEDRDMWIRVTAKYGFWLIDRPLALIRRHGSNMSKNAVRMKQNSRAVMVKAWRAGIVSHLDFPFWLQAFSVHFFQISWTHFDAGLRGRAFVYLAFSLLLWPIFIHSGALLRAAALPAAHVRKILPAHAHGKTPATAPLIWIASPHHGCRIQSIARRHLARAGRHGERRREHGTRS